MTKGREKKLKTSKFIKEWAEYKIDHLLNFMGNMAVAADKSQLPDWQDKWFTFTYNYPERENAVEHREVLYSCWDDFLNERSKAIENFAKSNTLAYTYFPYDDIINDAGIYKVLKQDCDYLIKIIEICLKKNAERMMPFIEDIFLIIVATMYQIYGRTRLRWEQKQSKAKSGIGQKRAQEKRIDALVESLRPYVNSNSSEIYIDRGVFCKLIDNTFVGLENYPRHPETIRTYRKAAKEKLNRRIILLQRKT